MVDLREIIELSLAFSRVADYLRTRDDGIFYYDKSSKRIPGLTPASLKRLASVFDTMAYQFLRRGRT